MEYQTGRNSKKIFKNLQAIGILNDVGELNFEEYLKLKSSVYMDLNLDELYILNDCFVISIAHNYIQNGDVMSDPDMEIAINPKLKTVYPLTFTQHNVGLHQRVYEENGFRPHLKISLDKFLAEWTTNLIKQGFKHNANKSVCE